MAPEFEVAVIGAGVVGCATALALARRGAAVALLEAEPEPGLGASGTNSGILHTGFDSTPGELETELILATGRIREELLDSLGVPVMRCGALMLPGEESERAATAELAVNARHNGVVVNLGSDGSLEIPGEAVTDPVSYTLALAGAATGQGADLRTGWNAVAVESSPGRLTVRNNADDALGCCVAVNCAGLHADAVARLAGDDSFEIYPRKGEFIVFDQPDGERLERILLPVPTRRTKGVLVFPTLDGKLVAGPTAVDLSDKYDWSVSSRAHEEILPKAIAMYPPLEGATAVAAYAGLRPAGRDQVNYLIAVSRACPRLINVAAIRSTGLTASLGIAELVAELVGSLGVALGPRRKLTPVPLPASPGPWWRRTAEHVAA